MATTKKVARGSSQKKKAAPKKSAVSSRVKKSATKKTLKKTPPKKISSKIKSVKKTSQVKKQSKKKLASSKKTLAKRPSVLPSVARTPLSLLVLAATRFPINIDAIAVQTARVGGLSIVALGAFFTLLFSQYIWNTPILSSVVLSPQTASVITAASGTVPVNFERNPPATFEVEAEEPLSSMVPIKIIVDDATSVEVLVFQESYTTPIYLGHAIQIENNIWEYNWDTTSFDDVRYKVVADIRNIYTFDQPYRDSDDSGYLQVSNNPTVTESVVATTTEAIVDEKPHVSIDVVQYTEVTGEIIFEIETENADRVSLIAQHILSGSINPLGDAQKESATSWNYLWNAETFTPGEYRITAKIKNQYGYYQDGEVSVTVAQVGTEEESDSAEIIPILQQDVNEVQSATQPPEVKLVITDSGTLSGVVGARVDVEQADFVELWAVPEGSEIHKIIALARKEAARNDRWVYALDTTQMPNGIYSLYARVKNTFGLYKSEPLEVTVYNEPRTAVLSSTQKEEMKQLDEAFEVEKEIVATLVESDTSTQSSEEESTFEDSETQDIPKAVLTDFKEDIDKELSRLTSAYRSGNEVTIERAEKRMARFTQELLATTDTTDEVEQARIEMQSIVADHKERSKKVEKIIEERVGDVVFRDSDSDGISDYDERTIFNTDPYSADSDNDGFNDGTEIFEGYDPLDSKRESAIVYQSPKESGVLREDILVVESIVALIPEDTQTDTDGVEAQAVITGKGLPNSFVTLYIFSTPTVVTVKTEADGSWKYRFDKELEDGEHNIYVGVTDNAGKIVAKSAAFTFVKEAQAFTPADAIAAGTAIPTPSNDSLLSGYMIYLILSISVVSIGLVLILLGLHLDTRQKRYVDIVQSDEKT